MVADKENNFVEIVEISGPIFSWSFVAFLLYHVIIIIIRVLFLSWMELDFWWGLLLNWDFFTYSLDLSAVGLVYFFCSPPHHHPPRLWGGGRRGKLTKLLKVDSYHRVLCNQTGSSQKCTESSSSSSDNNGSIGGRRPRWKRMISCCFFLYYFLVGFSLQWKETMR